MRERPCPPGPRTLFPAALGLDVFSRVGVLRELVLCHVTPQPLPTLLATLLPNDELTGTSFNAAHQRDLVLQTFSPEQR